MTEPTVAPRPTWAAAYKGIDQVMADQAERVEVLHTLRQVLNYKGT